MTKEELAQQLLRSKGGTKTVSTNSRESLYDSLINANKPSPKNKVTVSKPSVSTTNRPSSTITSPKSFTSSLRSFWGDVQRVGVGGAIADRLIPAKERQPQAVAEKNVQTFVQKPLQEAEVVERTGRQGTAGFVGAISPVLDFMAFAHSVDKDTMNRIASAKGQPRLIQTVAKNYGDMQGSKSESVANISGKVKELENKISVKDPNAIDEVVKAFGSTLAFFVAGVVSGGSSLPTLLETYGNMGEVVKRTEGKPLDERNRRVLTDGVVNGVVNYFTNKFGLFSTEEVGLKKILSGFMGEAFQEGEQTLSGNITSTDAWGEYWQKLIENKVKKKPMFSDTRPIVETMFQGVKESAVLGGIMGSMFSLADLSPNTDTTVEEKDQKKATKVEETKAPADRADNVTKAPEPAKTIAKAETDPLIAEARKYKSADEFVKNRGITAFHGSDTKIDKFDLNKAGTNTDTGMYGKGIYFSSSPKEASTYARKTGNVEEYVLDLKNPYVINTKEDIPNIEVPNKTLDDLKSGATNYSQKFTEYLQSKGYDGVIDNLSPNKQYVVFNPEQIKTKSQLIDIWNQAQPTKGVDPLIEEARKYKSAEEFVKAQGQSVFRGGDTAIDTARGSGRGISVSDKETAGLFTPPEGGLVDEAILPKTVKILKEGDIPKNLQDAYIKEAQVLADPKNFSTALQKSVIEKQQAIIEYARKNGFDAVDFPFEKEIRVVKPNVLKTKSQLTDIWNQAQTDTISEADKKDFEDMGLKVPEDAKSTKTTTIPEAEKQIQDAYTASQDKVDQAFSEVFAEMEIAEAGRRIFLDQPDSSQRKVVGVKSTFPEWIPEDLRSRELFDAVMSGMSGDVTKLKFPDKNKTKQRQLYNEILAEVDKRSGVDTSEARSAILDLYEKPIQKQEAKQATKPADRSSTGRKETTAEEKLEKVKTFKNAEEFIASLSKEELASRAKKYKTPEEFIASFNEELNNIQFEELVDKQQAQAELDPEDIRIAEKVSMENLREIFRRFFPNVAEFYKEDGIRNVDDYLENIDSETIAMEIDSDRIGNESFIRLLGDDELAWEMDKSNIIDLYKQKLLTPSLTKKAFNVKDQKFEDIPVNRESKFYETSLPQQNADIKKIYEVATSRASKANQAEVVKARKELFLAWATNKDVANQLGVTPAELNKKIRTYTGASVASMETQNRINSGVPDQFRWTGITNSNFIFKNNLPIESVDKVVNSVRVRVDKNSWSSQSGESLRRYIMNTFLSIDTRLNYSDLNFDVGTLDRALGQYSHKELLITIATGSQNTVAHEIGHYLDYRFSRELGVSIGSLSDGSINFEYLQEKYGLADEHIAWAKEYIEFVRNLQELGDVGYTADRNEYLQKPTEVFARFTAKFVDWVATQSGYNHSDLNFYSDKFSTRDYQNFIKLLQKKAEIDTKYNIKPLVGGEGSPINASMSPDAKQLEIAKIKSKLAEIYNDNNAVKTPSRAEQGLPVGQGKQKDSAFLERVKEQLFYNDPTSFEFDEQTGKYNEMNLEENAQRATDFIVSNPKEAIAVSLGLINPPQGVTANAIGLGTMLKARDEKNFNLYRDIATSVTLRSTRLGQEIVSLRGQMNDNSPENFVKRAINARMKNISKSLLKDVEIAGRSLSDTKKEVTKKIDEETVKLKKKLSKDKIKIQKAQDIIDALRC